ncbi:conserved hypothetical protein [Sporisorium reilianum SRZ2]|uniref:Uncharacterized protein n=1 Tax=Sporisorium reilianum (strain SRZ2) TaxID=999809 RepID=E6ZU60_SPORE|nr:conserved hypothetical protein [Sporisorium reilianum SRZ2]
MIDLFAQQQQQHPTNHFGNLSSPTAPQHPPAAIHSWTSSAANMDLSGHFDAGAEQQQQYPYQQHSSPAGPSGTSRISVSDATTTTHAAAGGSQFLPHQSFSSPTQNVYPASTLAAVEATRARFFAQQSGSSSNRNGNGTRSAPRSRPTLTGSTLLPRTSATDGRQRAHKAHVLSSASTSAYRQSFFERCQRAMDQSRTTHRQQRITAFRKGADAFTRGLFSDDMDVEDDELSGAASSSPPPLPSQEREEDDELTRHRILAEYSRLKRIYELKGHLEIGWIDPDQLSWLENEVKQRDEEVDPYWLADDEQLEQLWVESVLSQRERERVGADEAWDEFGGDAAFEEELARLPV